MAAITDKPAEQRQERLLAVTRRLPKAPTDRRFGIMFTVSRITVYEKPTCTTCKNLAALLEERGIEAERVDYHVFGMAEEQLREIVKLSGTAPRDLLRPKEPLVSELGLEDESMSDDERIRLMSEHPQTIQRPIVVAGDRAILARPPERVLEILD